IHVIHSNFIHYFAANIRSGSEEDVVDSLDAEADEDSESDDGEHLLPLEVTEGVSLRSHPGEFIDNDDVAD
ncbi:hypothetical protein PMAYCL1PPCAC_17348, partial [Pristionchus mayeri]